MLATMIGAGLVSQSSSAESIEQTCVARDSERPSVGLVLGGGGARGSAHIGVIKQLEEMRIPVDCVVGTSMGALVGGLYATGMSAAELEETIRSIDWGEIFNDETPRSEEPFRRKRDDEFALYGPKVGIGKGSSVIGIGVVSGQKISFLLESLTSPRVRTTDFDELAIPFRAVAGDLLTGEKVVLSEGDLAHAMRASMSIPGVFDPVRRDGRLLVDGMIAANLPVQVARDLGAEVIIAVNVGAALPEEEDIKNVLSVVGQLVNLMVRKNVNEQLALLGDEDILIKPPLPQKFTSASFDRSAEGIEFGSQEAAARSADLAHLALSAEDYAASRSDSGVVDASPIIDFVQLDNQSRLSDELIRANLSIQPGERLDLQRLEEDIRRIYAIGFLDLVRYEMVPDGERLGLLLEVQPDSRGSEYLEWGLDLFSDSVANGFNIRLGYLKADVDELGSEFRIAGQVGDEHVLLVDLYKYLDARSHFFLLPQLFAEQRHFTEYNDDGDPLSIIEFKQYGAGLGLGYEIANHASVVVGVRGYRGEAETELGDPGEVDEEYRVGEYYAGLIYDRLDDRYLPSSGNYFRATYLGSIDSWTNARSYTQMLLFGIHAHTFDRHTLLGGLSLNNTLTGAPLAGNSLRIGGFLNLSGFHDNEIGGQNSGVVFGSYQYRIGGSGLAPAKIGVSLEYGGLSQDSWKQFDNGLVHGSVFAAYRSKIGPVYIGGGFGEGGRSRFFLRLGRIFGSGSVIR